MQVVKKIQIVRHIAGCNFLSNSGLQESLDKNENESDLPECLKLDCLDLMCGIFRRTY